VNPLLVLSALVSDIRPIFGGNYGGSSPVPHTCLSTVAGTGRTLKPVDPAEPDRDQIIAKVIADAAELLAITRLERDRREAAGEDTTIVDQVLPQLEQLAAATHNMEIFQKVQAVVDRHGAGPYPPEDLAALAGADVDEVRALLAEMMTEGLAWPATSSPDDPSTN
jgi:hypothetical protein